MTHIGRIPPQRLIALLVLAQALNLGVMAWAWL